jgi:hypothetical protein
VRCVAFAKGDRKFLAVTDPFTKLASSIYIYKLDPERPSKRTFLALVRAARVLLPPQPIVFFPRTHAAHPSSA